MDLPAACFGFFGLRYLKGKQTSAAEVSQKFEPPRDVLDLIRQLEERAALTAVDLNDPMFAGLDDAGPEPEQMPTEEVAPTDQEEPG